MKETTKLIFGSDTFEIMDEKARPVANVATMKSMNNLVPGNVIKTLGYYEPNDGGAGLYLIKTRTDEHIEDNGAIHFIGEGLIAELIIENKINVKQFGCYGNNENDDTTIIEKCIDYCLINNRILYFPIGTYLVDTLNLKSLKVKCEGYINNTNPIVMGAISTGATLTVVDIFRCNDVKIEGAKGSKINILHARDITLYADGTNTSISSIAYNKITGLSCNSITLNGVNNGWINENEINIKRCMSGITITGDGTYSHNNNHFNNICIEGTTTKIQIDYGHNNYITYRGEDNPQIILSSDYTKTFGNSIEKQISSNVANTITPSEFNSITNLNFINSEYLPNYRVERIFELNKYNVKKLNSALYLDNNNKIVGSWQYEFASQKLDASFPFMIYVKSSHPSQRLYITCYDENDNKVEGNILGGGLTYDSTNKQYKNTSNASAGLFTFIPSDTVKYIELIVGVGSNVSFDYMTIDMYLPFTNTQLFANTIKTDKKYLNQIPSNVTANNPTWEVGDIVYNLQPTTNLGWVCTTGGTGSNSIWKEIPIS